MRRPPGCDDVPDVVGLISQKGRCKQKWRLKLGPSLSVDNSPHILLFINFHLTGNGLLFFLLAVRTYENESCFLRSGRSTHVWKAWGARQDMIA